MCLREPEVLPQPRPERVAVNPPEVGVPSQEQFPGGSVCGLCECQERERLSHGRQAVGNDLYPGGSLNIGSDRQQNTIGNQPDLQVTHSRELPFQCEPAPSVTEVAGCGSRGVTKCPDCLVQCRQWDIGRVGTQQGLQAWLSALAGVRTGHGGQ